MTRSILSTEETEYFHYPEDLSASQTPLCARFPGLSLLWGSTIRVTQDGTPMLQVFLQSERPHVRVVAVEPVNGLRHALTGNGAGLLAEVDQKFSEMIGNLDQQLAALLREQSLVLKV